MNVCIDDKVFEIFPELEVSSVLIEFEEQSDLAGVISEMKSELGAFRNFLGNIDPITQYNPIATWRAAYGKMGVKPSKFHSSIEALTRRVVKDKAIETGIHAVDFYNLVSVLIGAPIGAYDVEKMTNDPLVLRNVKADTDNYNPLGSSSSAYPLKEGVVVYAQNNDVLCWGINSRDSEKTCLDAGSKKIAFFTEGFNNETADTLQYLCSLMGTLNAKTSEIVTHNYNNQPRAI